MQHNSSESFWIEGHPKPANLNEMSPAMFYLAESGFQQAMGINLQRGRFITPQDDEHSPVVIVIDDVFARTYFPGENPIGKHVHLATFEVEAEIVGVVVAREAVGPRWRRKISYPSTILSSIYATPGQHHASGGDGRGGRSAQQR